jgi:cytochrome c biogenesis protein CcdA
MMGAVTAPPPGYPQPYPSPGYPPPHATASSATTVLVLGIVGLVTFFTFCGLGVVPAIIALVLAPGARREIEASGGTLGGASQVRAGTIMAWITLGLTALLVIIVIAGIVLLVSSSDSSTTLPPLLAGTAFDLRARAG